MGLPLSVRFLVLSVPLLASVPAAQATIRVPQDYATIFEACAAANFGDTVLVSPGLYVEGEMDLSNRKLRIVSTDGPDVTIIEAWSFLFFSSRIFYLDGSDVEIDGFTLRNSRVTCGAPRDGGAIYAYQSNLTMRDCVIENCVANDGRPSAFPGENGGAGGSGGGLALRSSSALIERCRFEGNVAGNGAAGFVGVDGTSGSPPTVGGKGGNGGAGGRGGAVFLLNGVSRFVSCSFASNRAGRGSFGGAGGKGGDGAGLFAGADGGPGGNGGPAGNSAVHVDGGNHSFENCTFVANEYGLPGAGGAGGAGGTGVGGAFNGATGQPGATGASGITGGVHVALGSGVVRNSILWSNDGVEASGATIDHSNVEGGAFGTGNLNVDPMLNGWQLSSGSPCIDAGDDAIVAPGSLDLAGHTRIFDHPFVANGVNGSSVDMGCHEYVEAFVLPHGCSSSGSLALTSGTAAPGATLRFVVSDTPRFGARAALLVGTVPDPNPCGTPTRAGRLLVDLTQPYTLLLGGDAGMQTIDLVLPPDPILAGQSMWVQGATVGPQRTRPASGAVGTPAIWNLLDALYVTIGA